MRPPDDKALREANKVYGHGSGDSGDYDALLLVLLAGFVIVMWASC